MSEDNLNLYNVLKLSEAEKSLVGEKIERILERLFLNGQGQAGALDDNTITGYTKKLCDAFKDPEARKGLLSVCRLLQELEDDNRPTGGIYNSLNGMNIDQFISITKSFRLKTDNFFCVSSDTEKVDPKKTKPALVIACAEELFNNKQSNILKFRDNTCKIGYACQEQWVCNLNGKHFGEKLRMAEHDLRRNQWKEAVKIQGYAEQEIKNKIGEDFRGCYSDGGTNIRAHFLARRLFREEKAKVFNITFRGRADSDTVDLDDDKYNIFSMLNKGLDYSETLKLSCDYYGLYNKVIRRLFDNIRSDQKLNELGLRITKRVLKLFLPEDQYNVNVTGYGDQTTINVVKKSCKYSEAAQSFENNRPDNRNGGWVKNKNYDTLDGLLKRLCIDNFKDGLSDEVDNFKQKLNSIDIGNIIKCMNDMGMSLDKNDIVDMLSDILYQIEPLDIDHPMNPKTLEMNRGLFACPDQWAATTLGPLDVIHEFIPRWLKKKSTEPIKNLPSAFSNYSSNDSKTVFSPIHYIQSLFAAPLIVKKYHEADLNTRKIIARNINSLRDALVEENDQAYNHIVSQLKYYQEVFGLSSSQEAFAFLICDGTAFTTKNDKIPKGEKDDITNICELAYNLTEFDLDNDMRDHVTQLNFVELVRNEKGKTTEGKLTGGTLVITMNAKRLFQENEFDVNDKEWDWEYNEGDVENNEDINNQNQNNNQEPVQNIQNQNLIQNNNDQNNNQEVGPAKQSEHDLTPEEWIDHASKYYRFQLTEEQKGTLKEHVVNKMTNNEGENKKLPAGEYYKAYKTLTTMLEGAGGIDDDFLTTVLGWVDNGEENINQDVNKNNNLDNINFNENNNQNQNLIQNNLNDKLNENNQDVNENNNDINNFNENNNQNQKENNNLNDNFNENDNINEDSDDNNLNENNNNNDNNQNDKLIDNNENNQEQNLNKDAEEKKEEKAAINYQSIYEDIVKSKHFCRNICVLRDKNYKMYKAVKEKHFNILESLMVTLYRICIFYLFVKKEFDNYAYDKQKYIQKKPVTLDKLPNIVGKNNIIGEISEHENQNIPSQQRQDLSNNQDKNEPGDIS